MKHPFRRVLALLLAAVLLVPLFALTASAATYDNVKCYNTVSSLGDSIATGFSMPDYDRQANGQYVIGKVKVEGSYPAIVSKAVEAKKFYPLAQPGFRTTELRVCMDPTYDGDYITEKWIRELSHAPSYTVPNLKAQRSEYAEDIRSSDLVLLDIGFNDTWLPVLGALMDFFDEKPSSASSDPTVTLAQTEAQGETDDTLSTIAFKLANGPRYAAQIYNAFAGILTTSDFQENYDAIVKRIYQLNPNATVVAVLNYNPFKDWEDVSWLAPIAQSLLYDRINAIKESYKQTYGSQYITVNVDNVEVRTTSASQAANDGWDPHPTAAGHQYIADQIIKALPSGGVHKRSTIRTLDLRNDVWGVYDVNGYLDTNYTGLARTPKNTWFVKEGVLDQTWSGKIVQDGHTFTVKYGKVTSNQYRDD